MGRSRHNKGVKPIYKDHRFNLVEEDDPLSPIVVDDALDDLRESDDEESDGEETVASINLDTFISQWHRDKWRSDREAREVVRAELKAKKIIRDWTNTPAEELPPSQRPGTCQDCGKLCSPNGMRCRPCWVTLRDSGKWEHPHTGYRSPCHGPIAPSTLSAQELLTHAKPIDEVYFMHDYSRWKPEEESAMRTLMEANATAEQVASILHRPVTKVVNRALERGLKPPKEWRMLLPYYKGPVVPFVPLMQFPYIKTARPENADLLRVNKLVPHAFGEDMRADIIQEVMLALFEGTVTMDDLERNRDKLSFFIKKFRKDQRPWQEMTGLGGGGDEKRSYEDIAAATNSISRSDDMNEARRIASGWGRFSAPTQIDDVYARQVGAAHWLLQNRGELMSMYEAEEELEAGRVKVWR